MTSALVVAEVILELPLAATLGFLPGVSLKTSQMGYTTNLGDRGGCGMRCRVVPADVLPVPDGSIVPLGCGHRHGTVHRLNRRDWCSLWSSRLQPAPRCGREKHQNEPPRTFPRRQARASLL